MFGGDYTPKRNYKPKKNMEVFNSEIATIDYFEETELIRTSWKKCGGAEDFMPMISTVMDFYELLLPKRTLWDHRHFNFQIPPDLQQWTDETINIPATRLNVFEKISFIVSQDVLSQMSVMEIFDETTSEFMPRYFVDEGESLEWLNKPRKEKEIILKDPPTIIIDRVNDKIKLSIEIETEEFDEYLHLFDKLWKARALSVETAQRLLTLTTRERTILKLLLKAKKIDAIADMLSISPHTVTTHRKNIYRKLECNTREDLMRYNIIARS